MQIKYLQEINKERQHHLWHNGDLIEIEYNEDLIFTICTKSIIMGDICDKENNHVFEFEHKYDGLASILNHYTNIKNDKELEKAIFFDTKHRTQMTSEIDSDYLIYLEGNSYYQLAIYLEEQDFGLEYFLEADFIEEAITEAIDIIPELIEKYIFI